MRLYRPPRASVHPAVQVLLSLVSVWGWMIGSISLICLYGWVFSIASDSHTTRNGFMPLPLIQASPQRSLDCHDDNSNNNKESSFSSQQQSPLVGQRDAFTVCTQAQARVASGEWVDPNDRRLFARQVETIPSFYISLHNESFDPVRWRIMTEGKYYEQYVYDRFLQILSTNQTTTNNNKKRSIILDVGANIGYYTLLSAALGRTVVSFEPNPANLLRLCESIRLNGWMQQPPSSPQLPQIYLLQQAVGDEHGSELMLYTPRNPGMGFLRGIGERGSDTNTTTHQAKTSMIRLDNFVDELGWLLHRRDLQIDILKIDVEGKEPQVVLGARKLLQSGLVRNVLTEGRRFGRQHMLDSLVVLYETGFRLVDPVIPNLEDHSTPAEKAKAIQLYYRDKLGPSSRVVTDLWWVKE